MSQPTVHELYRALVNGQLSRREFIAKAAAIGVTAPALGFFLKAADARAQEIIVGHGKGACRARGIAATGGSAGTPRAGRSADWSPRWGQG